MSATKNLNEQITEATEPLAELTPEQQKELEEKLKGMMPIYHNAPEDLDEARKRIMELELVLADLHRAAEIAVAVRDFNMLDSFLKPAETALEKKITVEYPSQGPMKITVVTGELEKKNAKA